MTSLHYSADAGLVVTAHPDGRVRLWDPRQRDAVGTTGDLLGNAQAQVRAWSIAPFAYIAPHVDPRIIVSPQVGAFYAGKEAHWVAQARFHPTSGTIFA